MPVAAMASYSGATAYQAQGEGSLVWSRGGVYAGRRAGARHLRGTGEATPKAGGWQVMARRGAA
eukprot:scaffold12634_cov62-Phaeocystis_antarctica.AAC.2